MFVTIWVVTRGGGGSRQTVTKGDKGGRGVKNRDFYGDILFEWPLIEICSMNLVLMKVTRESFLNFTCLDSLL